MIISFRAIAALFILALVAELIFSFVCGFGIKTFQKQAVAWTITGIMVVFAIGYGIIKSQTSDTPVPMPDLSEDVPYSSWVMDEANVLSWETEEVLDERNEWLADRYGVVIGVVTCNYGRNDLGDYALRRADDMGLGEYDFIVVLDISGKNYWLVQGAGLVWDFTDDDCSDYAYEYMEYWFARGNYNDAVRDLTEALEAWCRDYYY